MVEPFEIKPDMEGNHLFSKAQIIVLALVLIFGGAFVLNRQFGLFERLFRQSVAIPSGKPYAEARVIGAYENTVLAERIVLTDVKGNALQKKLEILTDGKTVFAKITSSRPIRITYKDLSEGDVIWVYNRVRPLEETIASPADPELAIPFEDAMKNPRERIKADFIVKVGGK